jgi:colanic acid/amylovoran biosynthesis glycosyltransferase
LNTSDIPMRIAYLVNQYPTVSHTFIRREILALERRGVEVMRIALRGWDGELVDVEDQLERERTRYVLREGAPALFLALMHMLLTRPVRLMRAIALAWRIGRHADRPLAIHFAYVAEACRIEPWLRATGIQHLHAHFGTNPTTVTMLVHTLGGPRWSFTVHGTETFDNPRLISLAEKVRRCAFVVAVSSYGRSQLFRWLDLEQWNKVRLVHCGLEPAFHSAAMRPAHATRRLVCVARLSAEKGHILLVEAAHRLARKGVSFQLVLAGDGEMRADIEALITRYNLQDKVRITGWINSEQVRGEILAARALVVPSFAEGLPVVIMEAMALRRPVIGTFVGGIPELVHPGHHGWLVPAGDVDALADAMQTCLDTPVETLACMGEAARKRVFERHDIDIEAAKLADLFHPRIPGGHR